jgi:hypothetical protein
MALDDLNQGEVGVGGFGFDNQFFDFLNTLKTSFQSGLEEFLLAARVGQGAQPGSVGFTGSVLLFAQSANTVQWSPSQDIMILDVLSVSGSIQWALTTSGRTYTQLFSTAGNAAVGEVIAMPSTNTNQSVNPCRFPVSALKPIYFANNSGTNAAVLIVFEPLNQSTS